MNANAPSMSIVERHRFRVGRRAGNLKRKLVVIENMDIRGGREDAKPE